MSIAPTRPTSNSVSQAEPTEITELKHCRRNQFWWQSFLPQPCLRTKVAASPDLLGFNPMWLSSYPKESTNLRVKIDLAVPNKQFSGKKKGGGDITELQCSCALAKIFPEKVAIKLCQVVIHDSSRSAGWNLCNARVFVPVRSGN